MMGWVRMVAQLLRLASLANLARLAAVATVDDPAAHVASEDFRVAQSKNRDPGGTATNDRPFALLDQLSRSAASFTRA